jgi:hypothetical protein
MTESYGKSQVSTSKNLRNVCNQSRLRGRCQPISGVLRMLGSDSGEVLEGPGQIYIKKRDYVKVILR